FEEFLVLRLAASVEVASEHPLSAAIVAGAQTRGIPLSVAEEFASVAGRGVSAHVSGRHVIIGNQAMLTAHDVDAGPLLARAEGLRADGQTVVFVAIDGRAAGLLG